MFSSDKIDLLDRHFSSLKNRFFGGFCLFRQGLKEINEEHMQDTRTFFPSAVLEFCPFLKNSTDDSVEKGQNSSTVEGEKGEVALIDPF